MASEATTAPASTTSSGLRLGPGATLPLGGDDSGVWRVEEGSVEVYLQPGDRRHFLASFRAGALLFRGAEAAAGLIALAPEPARLRAFTVDELLAAARDPAGAAWVARMLDHWILGLSSGILSDVSRRPAVLTAKVGDVVEVAAGASLAATGGIAWVRLPVGRRATFLDEVELAAEACVPLSPATWVTVAADSALAAHGTLDAIAQNRTFADLRAFHDLLGRIAERRARERAEREGAELAASQTYTSEALSAALGRLDGLLIEKRAPRKVGDCEFVLRKVVPDVEIKPALPPGVDLAQAVALLDLKTREILLSGRWWIEDIGRLATTRLSDGKPVALVTDWLGRYRCHCNEESSRLVTDLLAEDLHPQANSLLAPMPRRKVTALDLLRASFRSTRRDFTVLLLASGFVSLTGLVLPVAMGYVIDTFVPSHMAGDTIVLGLFVATVTLASTLVHFCANIARQRMDGTLEAEISGKVMERILHLPSRTLKNFSAADLAMRFASVDQVRRTVMSAGLDTLLTGLFGLSGLVLLFAYSPAGGLMVLLLFAILMAVSVFAGLAQLRAIAVGNQMTASESTFRLQMINNVSTLRAYSAERRAFSHWAANFAEMRARGLRSRIVAAAFRAFVALYPGLALAAVFLALGTKNAGGLSTGSYLAFLTAYQNFAFASLGVAQSITQLIGLQPTIKRAASVLVAAPEVTAGAKPPGLLSGAVSVSHVGFSYSPEGRKILEDIDFEVKAGEFVAICGASGSGKSTLLNLLVGFDRPTSGAVHFDGQDLAQLDLGAVRRQIGLVRQTSRLFGGTIAENIIGARRASLEDAWFAAGLAGIADDIHKMPMGMHTMITEGVSTFSGGQLQRLMIARSLVARPKIVVFDEATSALDNITQSEVTSNIERLGATRILVAHRLSTVRNADRILFLKDGVIVEQGSYDELIAADGLFANFGRRQMLEESHA